MAGNSLGRSLGVLLLACALDLAPAWPTATPPCSEAGYFSERDVASARELHDFWVVVRALGDCEVERQVTVLRSASGVIEARVLRPRGGSAAEQQAEQGPPARGIVPSDPCRPVEMEAIVITAATKPELAPLLAELESMAISPVFEPVIFVHGVTYRVWVGSSLNVSYFDFEGPPFRRSARQGPIHPLDRWAQELFRVLGVACELSDS